MLNFIDDNDDDEICADLHTEGAIDEVPINNSEITQRNVRRRKRTRRCTYNSNELEDNNNDNGQNLNHFAELRTERENTAVGQTSSRQASVLVNRGRSRRRNFISLQRSQISSEINNPERRHTLEQINISVNPEIHEQNSSPTLREDAVHTSENVSYDGTNAASQIISLLNSSDEDIRIPPDDYSNLFPNEKDENEDIPYYPVEHCDKRTSDCCCVCLVEKADHTFIPCGHLCCCIDCILKMQSKTCPICNVHYDSYMKIIIP